MIAHRWCLTVGIDASHYRLLLGVGEAGPRTSGVEPLRVRRRSVLAAVSALAVAVLLAVGGYAWFQRVDDQFAREIEAAARGAAADGRPFAMTDAIQNRMWDTLHVFGPYVSRQHIEQQIGGTNSRLPEVSSLYDGRQLIVFARDGRPIFHIEMSRCFPDFVSGGRTLEAGVPRKDARFVLTDRGDGECLVATLTRK